MVILVCSRHNTLLSFVGRQILHRSIVSGLKAWAVVVFVHEEYLGALDMTSHVGTIPTGLASYFLV